MHVHLERQAEKYKMTEKKVIAFIVEDPSDEAALGTIMKEHFSSNEVRFVVVHGDITLNDYVSHNNIVKKINAQIDRVKIRYRYHQDDFLKIIHITDADGVYISKSDIAEADIEKIQYYEDHINAKNASEIAERNKRKGDILYKLRKTGKVNGIPYRIYFNSCNLEHVLYGELKNQKTWDYIEQDKNSLNRHTNMHLIFE